MTAKNSKKTAKKTGSSAKKASQKKKATIEIEKQPEDLSKDIILWTVLAVCILLFLSNLGIGGVIGNGVSSILFGIFGLTAYVFPIVFLIGTFFAISNKRNSFAIAKLFFSALFLLFLCSLIELMIHGSHTSGAIMAFHYGWENKSGGGFLGGGLARLLVSGFGLIGAYVVTIAVLLISLIMISEKSAIKGLQKNTRHLKKTRALRDQRKSASPVSEIAEPKSATRSVDKSLPRSQRKVGGVAMDTKLNETLPAESDVSDEVSEVNIRIYDEPVEIADVNRVSLKSDKPSESEISTVPKAVPEEMERAQKKFTDESEPPVALTKTEAVPLNATSDLSDENVQKKTSHGESGGTEEKPYRFPPVSLLHNHNKKNTSSSRASLQETAVKLQQILKNFGVNVTVTDVSCGPAVTRYEIQPEMGVKVSKIVNLADDIKLNLAAEDIRIEAPIPGKAAVGIEVPNKQKQMVSFRELVESEAFKKSDSKISFAVGKDISGRVVISNIAKMPHLLIAGATGSGKSVCINTIIMSILYKADPREVKLIMVDPKVVELSVYNGIPHLLIPVVTDPKKAAGALHWAVTEMMERYERFADAGVRDMKGYNAKIKNGVIRLTQNGQTVDVATEKMPQIVIIVDELADLMMVAASDVEESICRLAQLARAAGIHLIIATQRPSVNVITGLIKANMPSRIAFSVTSNIDSRTILDAGGAEKLLGNGDMLYYPQGFTKPVRVQGAFVSDDEVSGVVAFLSENNEPSAYSEEIQEKISSAQTGGGESVSIDGDSGFTDTRDTYFEAAGRLILEKEKGSIGMLQRNFKVGFNRAARIMDQLEEAGVVGPEEGTKPRRVLMSVEEFEQIL